MTVGFFVGLSRAALMSGVGYADLMPPVPINVFLIRNGAQLTLFDAGCSPEAAAEKRVADYIDPDTMLRRVGASADEIDTLVISHLHWDHATQVRAYPRAKIILQRSELEGWRTAIGWGQDFRWVYQGRVGTPLIEFIAGSGRASLLEGDAELAPGMACHLAPGHTFGSQVLSVETAKGKFVLASDVVTVSRNLEEMVPMGVGLDQIAILRSYVRAREIADAGLVIPGHDSTLTENYPAVEERVVKIA